MVRRTIKTVLAAVVATVAILALSPGAAHADNLPYDGQYAEDTNCGGIQSLEVVYVKQGSLIIGTVELRYSSVCKTVWARTLAFGCNGCTNPRMESVVQRQKDNKTFYCGRSGWSNDLQRVYCLTPMVNDKGLYSRSLGAVWGSDGQQYNAYTGWH